MNGKETNRASECGNLPLSLQEEGICCSFAPVGRSDARILILGSMPGVESLRRQQYYAFPRNVFWRMMGEILNFDASLPYEQRLEALQAQRVALWDVLASCERSGSLDGKIRNPVPNPIDQVLKLAPGMERICCNGGTAYRYCKRFFPELQERYTVLQLPSSSPAAARDSYAEKLQRWRAALATLL